MTDVLQEAISKIQQFESMLLIDKNDLDTALQTQADIYHKVCMEHAYAISRKDAASENVKVVDAHLNIDVRKVFEQAGEKATEAKISAEVQLSKKHQDAYEDYSKASLAASLWGTLKDSFHQRAYMLREMSGLYISGYWIGDSKHKELGIRAEHRMGDAARNTTRRIRSEM